MYRDKHATWRHDALDGIPDAVDHFLLRLPQILLNRNPSCANPTLLFGVVAEANQGWSEPNPAKQPSLDAREPCCPPAAQEESRGVGKARHRRGRTADKPGRRARHAASGVPPAPSRASWSGFPSAFELCPLSEAQGQRAAMTSRWEQLNRLNVSDISIINEPLLMQRHGRGEAGSSDLVRLLCSRATVCLRPVQARGVLVSRAFAPAPRHMVCQWF